MSSTFSTLTCFAVLGVSVVCVGVTSIYYFAKIHASLHKELVNISESVSDLKKEISELKGVTKRKGLAAGSSFSDETSDVYYDFSDEGEASPLESEATSDDGNNQLVGVHRARNNKVCPDEKITRSRSLSPVDGTTSDNGKSSCANANTKSKRSRHSLRSVIHKIDEVLENLAKKPQNFKQLYNKIQFYHDKYFNRHDYLWRLAKACHLCGVIHGESGNDEKKKQFMQDGLKYASSALELADDDANVQKWYAICIGSCAEFETIQNKIKYGFAFKEHAELALQLNAADESLYYLMGRWCYEVAMMPWVERKVASTIFDLPNATLEEARNYFLTAEKLYRAKGVWKENLLFIAKTYIGERNYTKAMYWLDKASNGESAGVEDPLILTEIENLRSIYLSYRS